VQTGVSDGAWTEVIDAPFAEGATVVTRITAAAKDARPLSIAIVEQTEGLYRAITRAPPTIDSQNAPRIVWPAACNLLESAPLDLALGETSLLR